MPKVSDQWLRDILDVLYQRRTVTRAEIVRTTRLNPASVSLSLQHLLQSGTVLKIGELESKGGRKREVLKLNEEAGYFVAVDLEGSRTRFALTNFIGDIRYRWEEDIEAGKKLSISKIIEGIERILHNLDSRQRSRVLAVGISHPGIVDPAGRITAVNLGWHRLPLLAQLEKSIDFPMFLEDAHRTCIMAEYCLGIAQNRSNCIYVMIGNGIGIGGMVDGKLLCGRDGMAGELGHITIDPSARDRCNCGRKGCLEAIASSPNIVRQYFEKTGRSGKSATGARITEVFERARQKDANALEVLDRAARSLGLALAHLANLLNPELIILGGDVINAEDLLLGRIREEMARHTLPDLLEGLTVTVSRLGLDIGLKGASSLAFRNSLEDSSLLKKICSPMVDLHPELVVEEARPGARSAR